ncbi:adenylyl-sulfate kinase [Solimicrobium silvestre]|uniref:Adenylyl-sulfate kinase n=1 Tax=Solimicrobium silvestre TaxID=2099400 RepID=A0A2S9H117_9BURK|nr:apsK: adenylylsulfate kinase [Solimicrobium silvestre]
MHITTRTIPVQNPNENNDKVCPTEHFTITPTDREKRQGHHSKVIWLTGLSGAGKSTIANALEIKLHFANKFTYILDGDNVRKSLNKDLGFDAPSRTENIRRISEVANMMREAGLIVIVTAISPFRIDREQAKKCIGSEHFIEVHISTPLQVCEQRDPKGLYKKSRSGQLSNMTGIDSPYELPENPAIAIDSSRTDIEASAELIFNLIYSSE